MLLPLQMKDWIPWIDGASSLAVVTGVAKVFEWFDEILSDQGRKALSRQLLHLPPDDGFVSWAAIASSLLDRVFGDNPMSLRFLSRSGMLSTIVFLLVAYLQYRYDCSKWGSVTYTGKYWIQLAIAFACINLVPDYVALLLSRCTIRIASRRATFLYVTSLAAIQIISTAFFAYLLTICLAVLLGEIHVHGFLSTLLLPFNPRRLFYFFKFDNTPSICIYSSLFTSAWIWVYAATIAVIELLHKAKFVWVKIEPYLDVENKPMRAVGRVAGLLAGAGYALILGLIWVVQALHANRT